jgi:hypothetical protein
VLKLAGLIANDLSSMRRHTTIRRPEGVGRQGRAAFSVLEVIAACVMLATAMVITVHVLTLSWAQSREIERRQFAVQEAANLLERLTGAPWETLDAELAAAQQLRPEDLSRLPGGELDVVIEPGGDAPRSKRIAVTLRWRSRSGDFTSPVRLTAWVFAAGSANE